MSKRRYERRHISGDSNFIDSTQKRPPPPMRPGTSMGFTPLPRSLFQAQSFRSTTEVCQNRNVYANNAVESSLSDGTFCGKRMPFSGQIEKLLAEDGENDLHKSGGLTIFRPPPRPDTAPDLRQTSCGSFATIPSSDCLRNGTEPAPEAKYPWRDSRKATTSSTEWVDSAGNTQIRPFGVKKEEKLEKHVQESAGTHFITTLRGKSPGGLMSSAPSINVGIDVRPATSLGFTEPSHTRPDFDTLAGIRKPASPAPLQESDLVEMRKDIYKKAVSIRRAFRKADPEGKCNLSREKFCSILQNIGLDLDSQTIQKVAAFLDPEKTGQIDYNKFTQALNLKETEGQYNPFLVERTYFGGAATIESAPKEKRAFTGEEIKSAYLLKERIAKAFDQKYSKASAMFRSVDENFDGALTPEEFVDKIRRFNLVVAPDQVKNMMAVLRFPNNGAITYDDFVNHIKLPDKWGFCSSFNYYLPLGQSGEKPDPLDSSVLENTKWKKQGRKSPAELIKLKKQTLKDLIEDKKEVYLEKPVATMVIPGKVREGHLDLFLLEAVRTKLKTMRKSTRDMFRLLDPRREGRISHDNFHNWVKKEQLGIPKEAVDELIDYFDQDHAGYIEMKEFANVIDPDGNVLPALPDHQDIEAREQEKYLKGAAHPKDPPPRELHPEAIHCIKTGEVSPLLLDLVQQGLEKWSRSIRHVFRNWDTDHDGYVSVHELREGMARMNLGITHSVAARLAVAADQDGNRKLDYNEFVRAFKTTDKSGVRATQEREVMNDENNLFKTLIGRNQEANKAVNPIKAQDVRNPAKLFNDHILPAGLINTRNGIRSRLSAENFESSNQSLPTSTQHLSPLKTAKGEDLFYTSNSKQECNTASAGDTWVCQSRDCLRESWKARMKERKEKISKGLVQQ